MLVNGKSFMHTPNHTQTHCVQLLQISQHSNPNPFHLHFQKRIFTQTESNFTFNQAMKRHFSSFQSLHDLNFEATELRLGLLPSRSSTEQEQHSQSQISAKQSNSESRSGRTDSSISTSTTNPSSDAEHCYELTK